jgi:outer membrane autotransporter protein
MNKLGIIGALAAVALMSSPTWAGEQAPNTDDQASTVATGPAITRVATSSTAGLISGRVSAAVGAIAAAPLGAKSFYAGPGMQVGEGKSAGGGERRIGIWTNAAYSNIEDDLSSTAYDGNVFSILVGADYQVSDRFLVGVAIGDENIDVDTTFNRGTVEVDGFTIAPYAGYVINRYFTVDVSGGYNDSSTDLTRTSPISGSIITGEMDSSRWFVGGNLNAHYQVNRISLLGRAGLLYATETQEAFTESDTTFNPERDIDLGQLRIGAQIAYRMGKVQPYVTGTFEYDFNREKTVVAAGQAQPANDRSGFGVGGGARFALSDRVSGGIEGSTHVGRDDFSSTTVSGNVRIKF